MPSLWEATFTRMRVSRWLRPLSKDLTALLLLSLLCVAAYLPECVLTSPVCASQVQSVLAGILDSVLQQVQARMQQQQQRQPQPSCHATDTAAASRWAAINPAALIQEEAGDDGAATTRLQCYYYSPGVAAQMAQMYDRCRCVMQPPALAADSVVPARKAPPAGKPASVYPVAAGSALAVKGRASTPDPELPSVWDCSISGLRDMIAHVAAVNKCEGTVLQQQFEAALRRAVVPPSRHDLLAAAFRHALLQLGNAVQQAAVAEALADSGSITSRSGTRSSGGGGDRQRGKALPPAATMVSSQQLRDVVRPLVVQHGGADVVSQQLEEAARMAIAAQTQPAEDAWSVFGAARALARLQL